MRQLAIFLALLLAAAQASADDACHDGVIEEGAIRWVSSMRAGAEPIVVPRELEIERIEGGRLGADSTVVAPQGSRVRVVSRQRLLDRGHVTLRVPRSRGAQRITLAAGRERVRFEPELDGPLTRHVGYITTAAMSAGTRERLERRCGAPPSRSLSIFATGDEARLRGAISTRSERRAPFAWLGGALLLVGLIAGAFVYRAFGRRAAIEHADALIRERFGELEDPNEKRRS